MAMWTCREVAERATDHLEGRLGLREGAGLRMHLAICPDCRRYLTQLTATVALLRALPAEAPEPETEARLRAAFRARRGPA